MKYESQRMSYQQAAGSKQEAENIRLSVGTRPYLVGRKFQSASVPFISIACFFLPTAHLHTAYCSRVMTMTSRSFFRFVSGCSRTSANPRASARGEMCG